MARDEHWEEGFVLHTRPFRETSVISDVLTQSYGRVSIVYRGVKSSRGKNDKARLLQPFQPLLLLWQGERELKTGKKVEANGAGYFLTGTSLYSALYLNELMIRTLFKEDPHPQLYEQYHESLAKLRILDSEHMADIEIVLRNFELTLLGDLGYEISLDKDADFNPVEPSQNYCYDPEMGFSLALKRIDPKLNQRHYKGSHLLAMASQHWEEENVRQSAKRLLRQALAPHLGDKPLESRQLFKRIDT